MVSIEASHVVVTQIGTVDGEPVPMNSEEGRQVTLTLSDEAVTLQGGGLDESYELTAVRRVEITPDGSRFGLMAPGEVRGFLVPEQGAHMVRVDAKTLGKPKKKDLLAFGRAVEDAVASTGSNPN